MIKKILLTVVVLVALAVVGVLGAALTKPDGFKVERSAAMAVPPEAVYQQVADFKAWDRWSPWAKLDPAMKTDFGGTPGQPGATYHWTGNDQVGEGRMTITEVAPPSRLAIKLEFLKPFASTSPTTFTFAPDGAGTRVSWRMVGTNGFVEKAFTLFMDFEKMIGADFDKGLSQLKAVAEAEARLAPAAAAAEPGK